MYGWEETGQKSQAKVRDGRYFSGIATSKCGRTRALTDEQVGLAKELYFNELLSIRAVADVLGVSHMTVWRVLREKGSSEKRTAVSACEAAGR